MPGQVVHYQNAVPGDRQTFKLAAQRAAAPWSLIAGGLFVKAHQFLWLCSCHDVLAVVRVARWNITDLLVSKIRLVEIIQETVEKEVKRLSGPLDL